MQDLNIALAALGALILMLGLFSRPIDRSWLSSPLLAFLLGVLLSSHGLGLLDPAHWNDPYRLMEETARLTLAISLMAIALRLPPRYPWGHWRSVLVLLGLAMPAMFLISSLLTYWVLAVPWLVAMLVGGAICATDPVIASAIVTGGVAKNNLPESFRHLLSTESGANDGLAYPLVMLPILLLSLSSQTAWSEWLLKVWLWEVTGSLLVGALLGWIAGKALEWAEQRDYVDQPSFLGITLALSFLVLGGANLLGTNSILAVFAAGLAFDQEVGGRDRSEEGNIQEAVNILFTMPVFVLFGLMAPWADWVALGWSGLLLAVLVLVLRRLPVLLLLRPLLPPVREKPIALVMGWFGPIGISALFYVTMIHRHTGNDTPWVIGSLMVLASVVAHGMSAAPLARLYHRKTT